MKRYLKTIQEKATELLKKYNYTNDKLFDNNIYYCNANDGTDFDYNVNSRTCEFFVWTNKEIGAIKLWFRKNQVSRYTTTTELVWYVFDYDDPHKVLEHGQVNYGSESSHKSIAYDLLRTRDKENLYDMPICEIDLSK